MNITAADREAARVLRDVLADASGFWHNCADDSALCLALARHRIEAEAKAAEGYARFTPAALQRGAIWRHVMHNDDSAAIAQVSA